MLSHGILYGTLEMDFEAFVSKFDGELTVHKIHAEIQFTSYCYCRLSFNNNCSIEIPIDVLWNYSISTLIVLDLVIICTVEYSPSRDFLSNNNIIITDNVNSMNFPQSSYTCFHDQIFQRLRWILKFLKFN